MDFNKEIFISRMHGANINQKLLYTVPLIQHTIVVCISNISPMAVGCFICVNINLVIVLIDINTFVIIGGILFKMLVLGINEIGN